MMMMAITMDWIIPVNYIIESKFQCVCVCVYSDTMGNKGAFVTLQGGDLKPNFTSYEAVVSSTCSFAIVTNSSIFVLLH